MLLSDYTTQVQFLIHDQSNQDFTQAELTNAINNARLAVALDFHCVRKLFISPPVNAPFSTLYNPVSVITNTEVYPLLGPNGLNSQIVGANITAGGVFTATVAALDPFGNTAAAFAGTVHFTSSDSQALLPPNTTLTSGTGASTCFGIAERVIGELLGIGAQAA